MADVNTRLKISSLILSVILLMMTLSPIQQQENGFEENIILDAEAREDDVGQVNCSGLTFEDLFDYDFASFDINILDDWATVDYYANSWVNGSNAATVRENLDELIGSQDVPGGGNGWLSTDERDAVRAIGPDCIADMDTRIGLKEGVAPRHGVEFNQWSFIQDGIALDEVSLVPSDHEEKRTCQNLLASNGCYEVPVSATDDLEISMFLADGKTHNTEFNQLPNKGVSNFTLAINVTNVTDAIFVFTFPQTQGLRMLDFSTMDDGVQNDALETPVIENLPNGRMRVSIDVEYPTSNYPVIREIFIDFTTLEVEDNDIPIWSSSAPDDGMVIPLSGDGTVVAVDGENTENWASDNHGWTLDCDFVEDGWSSQMDADGAFIITSVGTGSSQATCNLKDTYGEYSELSRTWTFGQLFSSSAVMNEASEELEFTITPTGLVGEMTIMAHAHQSENMADAKTITVATSEITTGLSLKKLRPGAVLIMGTADATNMMTYSFMLNFGLEKSSSPPVIELVTGISQENATWDESGLKFTLKGTVIDPDGEEVTLLLSLCGGSTTDFTQVGTNWEIDVSIASCMQQGITEYDVIISATDESGVIGTLSVFIPDPYAEDNGDIIIDDGKPSEEGGLPSLSMLSTLIITLLAMAFWQRKQYL
ncbi:MAG: hypothetical protein GWO84_00305 [Euryarchaeota archaeon]|nr:hypothetical protein [Euryarchaeota archaeon]